MRELGIFSLHCSSAHESRYRLTAVMALAGSGARLGRLEDRSDRNAIATSNNLETMHLGKFSFDVRGVLGSSHFSFRLPLESCMLITTKHNLRHIPVFLY